MATTAWYWHALYLFTWLAADWASDFKNFSFIVPEAHESLTELGVFKFFVVQYQKSNSPFLLQFLEFSLFNCIPYAFCQPHEEVHIMEACKVEAKHLICVDEVIDVCSGIILADLAVTIWV